MIGFGSSDNQVGILIKTTSDTKGIDQTTGALGNLDHSAGISAKSAALMGAVAGAAQVGIMAFGGAIKGAGEAAIGGAASFEQNRVAFETMLGSADKARTLLTQISKFAKETPFELPEVVQGSKQLLAFGFSADQIIPTMRKLGDIASGVGIPVGQLAYVFGQVRVAGKLMGGDLMQFTNAGVPMIEGLSKVLHVSQGEVKAMVEQGKVGFSEVQQVIDNMTGSGSQFGGMMEKQSHTFNGVVSNIKDGFSQMLRSAVGVTNAGDIVQGGFFDKLKSGAQGLMPVLQRMGDNMAVHANDAATVIRMLFDLLSGGDPTIKASEAKFGKFADVLAQIRWIGIQVGMAFEKYLMPSFKALWRTLANDLGPSLKKLSPYLDDIAMIVGGALVGALWVAINVLNLLVGGINRSISQFFALKNAIGTIVDWIAARFRWMGSVWNATAGAIGGASAAVGDAMTAAWNTAFEAARAVFSAIWETAVKPVLDFMVSAIKVVAGVYTYVFDVIRGLALVAWWAIYNEAVVPVRDLIVSAWWMVRDTAIVAWQAVYATAVKPVMDAIAAAANWVGGIISAVWSSVAGAAASAWGAVRGFAIGAWQSVAGVWQGVAGWFQGIWNSLVGGAGGAAGGVRGAFAGVAEDIKNVFKNAINWIIDKLNSLVRSVNGSAGKLPGVPKISEIPRFESGVRDFGGGMAVVGDVMGRGGEIVQLPRGSNVYNNQESRGMVKGMGGSTFIHNGDVILSTPGAVREWFDTQGRNSELAQQGLTTIRGLA
jgi:tape measure domain-containing protein